MKSIICTILLVCGLLPVAAAHSSSASGATAAKSKSDANPIQKVLELLASLQAKVIKEGEDEQKVYDEFTEWCEDESKQKQFEVKNAKSSSEELKATIEKATADIDTSDSEISDLGAVIARSEADLKAATKIREKENKVFVQEEAEMIETVDILERAIGILEKEMAKHNAALLQTTVVNAASLEKALSVIVDAGSLSVGDKAKLTSLLQQREAAKTDDGDKDAEAQAEADGDMYAVVGAPDPAAYKGHSKGIIEVLEDMQQKAEDQLAETRKAEMNAKHNYELLAQSLKDEIENQGKNLDAAKRTKAAAEETKATAEGDLAVTSQGLNEDTEYLKNIHQDCMMKAADFEAATKSRDAELETLAQAKKIIQEATAGGEQVVYGAGAGASSFLQFSKFSKHSAALRQGSGSEISTRADLANFEVVHLIQKLAQEQQSAALTQLAQRIRSVVRYGAGAGEDPFAKVKGLIKDMIDRLVQEAHDEATHKAYCDEEMGETKEKQEALEATIDKLRTKIDKMSADIDGLKGDIATLQSELASLAKAQAEMDAIRQKEHEEFVFVKKETEEGVTGVQMALKVLRDYYASSGDDHGKASGAGNGIIGLLEVVESDFTRSLAAANTAEDSAAAEYDRITKENEITKVTKEQDVKYKTKEMKGLEKGVAEAKSDLTGTESEYAAINEYWEKLKPQCIVKALPYEERKKRREAEIAGLKEALDILEGEAVLMQKEALMQKTVKLHHASQQLRGAGRRI